MSRWILLVLWALAGCAGWVVYHVVEGVVAPAGAAPAHRPVNRERAVQLPALSLSTIFAPSAPSLQGLNRSKLRTLIATGDVIPARSVNYKMFEYHDYLYPFRKTAGYLRRADITLVNLESPLVAGCPVTVEGLVFCGDPRAIQGLKFAGVDVACTANNHIGNYGNSGIQQTWTYLREAGIKYCGLGETSIVNVRGLRFAFLAYNCVGQRFDYATARQEIRAARKKANVVVVSVHWGKEYVALPQTESGIADDNPRQVAHWIIDSGADLVIGNHPHHVQGVEFYHKGFITYAHGNFIFDQMFSEATREGVVGTYTFYGRKLIAVHFRPVYIVDYSQPHWADGPRGRSILAGMAQSSRQLARMASA